CAGLGRRVPRLRSLGAQTPAAIAELLRDSRVLVLSSRWESGPIVAFEALACGASVVGPACVPVCEWICAEGAFGSLFTRRSGAALGAALVDELTAWEDNRRDPETTAAVWRPRLDPAAICAAMLPERSEGGRCYAP